MTVLETKNEQSILEAARKTFLIKGFDGTSTQEIAEEAGTTKSMVNYYFRSKERLFAKVFRQEFKNLFASIGEVLGAKMHLKAKIERIVALDLDHLISIPELPVFIMSELHRNPELLLKEVEQIPIKSMILNLEKDIIHEVNIGTIRYIAPIELMINIQSLTIYPILAKPMLIHKLGLSEKVFGRMMEKRKIDIVEFIWNGIKIK